MLKIKLLFTALFFLLHAGIALAQQKYTLSGTISDAENGETMIGATISVKDLSGVGSACNEYGYYALTLEEGTYSIIVSYIGYAAQEQVIELNKNIVMDFKLSPDSKTSVEVIVSAEQEDDNLRNTEIGVEKIDVKEVEKLPVIFGEKDILKTIQLLPGVKSAGEGNSGFFVRGGSADQNLIVLDEAPVYNASHLLGFFSTFNSDALKDVTIIKGNAPAQYGGRLSSVLDVKMKEPLSRKSL